MASIHRKPRSPYWYAAWRQGGRLHLRTTKQRERSKALTVALQWERAAKLGEAGELTEAQARKVLNEILEATATGEHLRAPSSEEFLRHWLAGKEAHKAEKTAERYASVVQSFIAHLGPRAKRPLTALVPRDVESFVAKRTKAGLASSTVVLDAKILRAALTHARRQGIVQTNVAEAVELPKRECVERGTFTPAEVRMMVDAAEGEWRTLILLGYYTGARLGDCVQMAWSGERRQGRLQEGVDLTAGTLTFWVHKSRKLTVTPLHPELQERLERLASTDEASRYILPGMADQRSGGRHGLSEAFKAIMRKAGLDVETVKGTGVRNVSRRTFHALRHSFTSALANAGVAPELRMKLTGHKSEVIHAGYTHHEIETLRAAVGKLPRL